MGCGGHQNNTLLTSATWTRLARQTITSKQTRQLSLEALGSAVKEKEGPPFLYIFISFGVGLAPNYNLLFSPQLLFEKSHMGLDFPLTQSWFPEKSELTVVFRDLTWSLKGLV